MNVIIESYDGFYHEHTFVDLGEEHPDLKTAIKHNPTLNEAIREHLRKSSTGFVPHPNQESHPGWYQLTINVGPDQWADSD